MTENRKLADGQRMEISFKKGQLMINSVPYKKKVRAPGASELLLMDKEELGNIKELPTAGGCSETESGSKFIGYACKVSDLEDVRKAYLHIKKLHEKAHHVTMAYRLEGINKAYDEDYVDNKEYNAGRKLLDILIARNVYSTAIFMVRYYGGRAYWSKKI